MSAITDIQRKKVIELSEIEKCILYTHRPRKYDRDFINENKAAAELAALTAERDALRARLEAAEGLVKKWQAEAWNAVPVEYSSRKLHYKYFKLDNEAAGMMTCVEELAAALKEVKSSLELSTPTATVLNEINVLRLKQKDIAKTCAVIIISQVAADWKAINAAIAERWSKSARERVLSMAWKMIEKRSFE